MWCACDCDLRTMRCCGDCAAEQDRHPRQIHRRPDQVLVRVMGCSLKNGRRGEHDMTPCEGGSRKNK